jgi:hypothetical protein
LWTNENSIFHLVLTYFGKFLPQLGKTFAFFIHLSYTYIFIKPLLICIGGKQNFYLSPKARCATFFLPGGVSELSGQMFNSVEAALRSAVLFALQAA